MVVDDTPCLVVTYAECVHYVLHCIGQGCVTC